MNLRRQLLLVSLLTLVLPWAGCQFVRETESALREGQQQMLSGTAMAISDSLSQFPDELLGDGNDRFGESQLYAHPLSRTPLIDGYFDDWPLAATSQRSLRGTDGLNHFVVGRNRQHLFLYVDVQDDSPAMALAGRDLSETDHVAIVTGDSASPGTRIVFAAEAPGAVQATVLNAGNATDSRIAAHWLDTAAGYRLEARIPNALVGTHAGVEINNARDGRSVVSRTFDQDSPGRLVKVSPVLESVASGYTQPGLRLIITDRAGWRLATAGSTGASTGGSRTMPSGWQLRAYRLLLEEGLAATLAEPDPSGREQQNYIARALNGEATASWFRNQATGRAVVAVARPVYSGSVQTGALVLQQDTDAILSLTNQSLKRLITLTIIATLGAGAALLGYASWLSLRIRRLSHAAEHALDGSGPPGNLPSALASDEIGDLSRSFSSVLRQLGDYNDYLRSLASKLSHELRTPLTIVTSSLENLDHEPLSDQSREYTERARDGAARLRKILSAMSEASRVEQLMENPDTEHFDLRAVVEATTGAYGDAWRHRSFSFTADDASYEIIGSPELLIQMLDKLVDNAVDFSADGDEITISMGRRDKMVSIAVVNPGPALPDTMRHRLFESMVSVRADASGDNLGLGLNIAKLIAEGHGGTISGENIEGGVMFTILIPAKKP